jgi:hypothetical protein
MPRFPKGPDADDADSDLHRRVTLGSGGYLFKEELSADVADEHR